MNKVVMQIYIFTLLVSFGVSNAWGQSAAASVPVAKVGAFKWHEPIRPLPQPKNEFPEQSALGDLLFHDPRLSADDTVSCASCHELAHDGIDHLEVAVGVGGIKGPIKTPTVYNSSFNFVQFWDGRAASLEEQAAGPVHNPIEMASNWKQVIAKLEQDPEMVRRFAEVYDNGITAENIVAAISAFERTLVTVNSPFDRWLRGDENALSEKEQQGYQLFKSYGCIACHQGANVGGNLFGKMGAMGDYFKDKQSPLRKVDMGRFNVTGNEQDRHMFKVPSLRLAANYSYFFHDAGADSLEQAIRIMGRYQLGRDIPDDDIALIAGFLHTLVGEHPRLKHE